jgi:hypothetical protein
MIFENSMMDFIHLFREFKSISFIYVVEFKNDRATLPLRSMSSWHIRQLIRNKDNCNFKFTVICIVCQNVYSCCIFYPCIKDIICLFIYLFICGLDNREYGYKDPSHWPFDTLYPQKLTLISPTSGGRSVGIGRSRAEDTEFFVYLFVILYCSVLLHCVDLTLYFTVAVYVQLVNFHPSSFVVNRYMSRPGQCTRTSLILGFH